MDSLVRISRVVIVIGSMALAIAGCTREVEPQHTTRASASAPVAGATEAAAPAASTAVTCQPPRRLCTGCTGTPICALRCPECPPPEAAQPTEVPATASLEPVVETCGGVVCRPGTFCCNPSCGICTPKGVSCTQQSCN